jgi:hypothetical protein
MTDESLPRRQLSSSEDHDQPGHNSTQETNSNDTPGQNSTPEQESDNIVEQEESNDDEEEHFVCGDLDRLFPDAEIEECEAKDAEAEVVDPDEANYLQNLFETSRQDSEKSSKNTSPSYSYPGSGSEPGEDDLGSLPDLDEGPVRNQGQGRERTFSVNFSVPIELQEMLQEDTAKPVGEQDQQGMFIDFILLKYMNVYLNIYINR